MAIFVLSLLDGDGYHLVVSSPDVLNVTENVDLWFSSLYPWIACGHSLKHRDYTFYPPWIFLRLRFRLHNFYSYCSACMSTLVVFRFARNQCYLVVAMLHCCNVARWTYCSARMSTLVVLRFARDRCYLF